MTISQKFRAARLLPLGVALTAAPALHAANPTPAPGGGGAILFNRDVRPILSDKCFACHGFDEKKREAKLRLDVPESAYEKEAVVPGKLEDSEAWWRITSDDEDEIMPPPEHNKPLTKSEIDILKQWIEQGAQYQGHWSFIAPQRPAVPAAGEGWAKTPVDRFIAARLDAEVLTPQPEADRAKLLRRVTFDLTGLPPTPDEIADFQNDKSDDAYEKVVDRLLKSERYGEHMARYWLDAARYGDTHGLHLDNYREIWPFRDWVIRAFNENKSYADFLTEQLAGDLLPESTLDQQVATGFIRCHVTTSEGGSIEEEVYVRNVIDRVETFGTVFLGLTAGCAQCHDHKYDPISQAEFYQLFAYFNSLDGPALDGNKKDPAPVVRVAGADQERQLKDLRDKIAAAKAELQQVVSSYEYTEPAAPQGKQDVATEVVWIDDAPPAGVNAQGGWQFVDKAGDQPVVSGAKAHTRTAQGLGQHFFDNAKDPLKAYEGDKLFTYVFLDPKNPPKEIMLQWNSGQWEHRAYWGENKIDWGENGKPSRLHIGALPKAGEWVRLEVDAKSVGLNPGTPIKGWAFTQFDGTVFWDKAGIVTRGKQGYDSLRQWIADERASEQPTSPPEIVAVLKKDPAALSDDEKRQAKEYFIENVFTGSQKVIEPIRQQIASFESQIAEVEKSFPTTLVFKESAQPKKAFLLERGEYDKKKDEVARKLPEFLPAMPDGAPNDRLGLAKWLLRPDHPLTARVAVNRLWQQVFGTGLVKTQEDFGSQGEWPSHPELLDWLAVEFRESGWDVKALMRMFVTSAAYRQSAVAPADLHARDPNNRLLARGPRFRLDAEMLRDQALAASGLLVEKVGGPSVKPPQPDGLWKAVGYSGSNTVRFQKDTGPDKVYRRSLYTFWKRTSPPPQMIDAPSRENCTVRRERTNTPLHALMFLNDPQYFETARAFAERLLKRDGSPEEKIAYAFERATSRKPTDKEIGIVKNAIGDHWNEFKANPEDAKKLIAIGESKPDESLDPPELAAWTMGMNLILNLDETLNK